MPSGQRDGGVFFPGLHGLRFFAALAVVIGHVELLKQYLGYPNSADQPVFYELGRIAVTFFFVLSGFLITVLLLVEKANTTTISVSKFYVRRILRIWPLYYLTVFLAFVIVPRIHILDMRGLSTSAGNTLPFFLAFLPQVALSLYPPVPYAEPLWSIGVEEQFYLLWPLLVKRVRNVLAIAIPVVVCGVLIKYCALWYASSLREQLRFWNHFIDYFYFNRFECMAIGAIGAWLVVEKKDRLLTFLYSRPVQVLVYVLTVYAIATSRGKPILQYLPHSVLFCIIVLNVACNPRSILKIDRPIYTLLGNISYAMYLLHEIAIALVLKAQVALSGTHFDRPAANIVLYLASVAATIGVSLVAYYAYERPFLRLKTRFAIVKSGPADQLA